MKLRQANDRYAEEFIRSFPSSYELCTLTLNPLQPADHTVTVQKRAQECQSEVILFVEPTYSGHLFSLDAPEGNDFSQFVFEMRSVESNLSFWKAAAAAHPLTKEYYSARPIVAKLIRDGVIHPEQAP
ncbi:hypothetical protein GCM10027347_51530 [Larkinella harenae]